jgi:hypothetical protein
MRYFRTLAFLHSRARDFFFFALEDEETENKWTKWTRTLAC